MRLVPWLAACVFVAASAAAQPAPDSPDGGPPPGAPPTGGQAAPPHLNLRQRFEMANVTHDGRLTRDQAASAGLRGIATHFDAIDADRKGYVTLQDVRAYQQARRQARAQPQQAPAPEPPPPPQ